MSETRMPLRGRTITRPSRASRCNASRIGVRPILKVADSICSEITSPGLSRSVTICSSIRRYACSVNVSGARLARSPLRTGRACRTAAGDRATSDLPALGYQGRVTVSFLRLRLDVAWFGRGFSGRLRYGHHASLAAIARTLIYVSYITDIRFCRSSQSYLLEARMLTTDAILPLVLFTLLML